MFHLKKTSSLRSETLNLSQIADVHTGASKMLHSDQSLDKPSGVRLLMHSIRTTNKPKKYDGNIDTGSNVISGKTQRMINLLIS